ncbi:hypothetical protein N7466_006058 [Penicillium verhagenii]|uniref:uncharacterized protein n=1 Tax=Penicillium verhagenii TaxID=1562060 RepID=UPI002545B7EE|nr:uncharacterized protein N7466_006058 [Penicillium verhagenii]KAJ5930565.1 hypothetical protein N7466_006058 [Penicillium verhagenii]
MHSPGKQAKHKRASLSNLFTELKINSASPSSHNNLAKSLRLHMKSTLRLGRGTVSIRSLHGVQAQFTIAMDDAYDYKIGVDDFDPETVFPEILTLADQLSTVLQKKLSPQQQNAFEGHILNCLAAMVYGSNMIERVGNGSDITFKLCMAVFRGEEVPEEIGETEEEFLELKKNLLRKNLPANPRAVLGSRREIVQHAKAACYMIHQLCICDKDLSEEIILQTHEILTYKINAETTPWQEYSGVYRTDEVSAGFHSFPHHGLVPYKMKSMIRELESDLKEALKRGAIDPIAIASKYTHVFVNIHPFIDGNGRMCRLILNSMLLKLGSFLVCLGEDEEEQMLYLDVACKAAGLEDLYGDLDEDEKPVMHKELASLVLFHVEKSMRKLTQKLK